MSGIIYAQQTQGGNPNPRYIRNDIIAINSISAYSAVTSTGTPADSENVFHKNIVAGIARFDTDPGFACSVVSSGEIDNPAWGWARGDVIFLNGVHLSTIPPSTGFLVIIGHAISPTKILVAITESILL